MTRALVCALAAVLAAGAGAAPAQATEPAQATAPAPLKVMALGDSITFGAGSRTMSSYRVDLRNRLTAGGLDVDFVGSQASGVGPDLENEGHSGWVIGQLSQQIDGWLATSAPDAVLLMAGTNDTARGLALPTAPNRLAALINRIRTARPAAHVFVATIVGMRAAAGQRNADAFNARIPAIVASMGNHVHLVDQRSIDGRDLRDNLHPDDVGFAKMSYNWFRGLEKVYNTTGTPWKTAANPYTATEAYHCILTYPGRVTVCRWWHLRSVRATVNGRKVTVKRWQTRRFVTETYRVRSGGHLVTKTRRVPVWSAT
jgi:lysophospholipase L1-like esterase